MCKWVVCVCVCMCKWVVCVCVCVCVNDNSHQASMIRHKLLWFVAFSVQIFFLWGLHQYYILKYPAKVKCTSKCKVKNYIFFNLPASCFIILTKCNSTDRTYLFVWMNTLIFLSLKVHKAAAVKPILKLSWHLFWLLRIGLELDDVLIFVIKGGGESDTFWNQN